MRSTFTTITVILNGVARKKNLFYKKIYPALTRHFVLDVKETAYAGHAEVLASQAAQEKMHVVLAAGGDGTFHQVVNGVLTSPNDSQPIVGLIPLGSGNDFARTCSVTPDVEQLLALLKNLRPQPTDVGEVHCTDNASRTIKRYFINECSIGMGPEVLRRILKSRGSFGAELTYLTSILTTFISHKPQEVFCSTPHWQWSGVARVLAIANGTSFGHALYIAPDAKPDDGIFNAFAASNVPLIKFLLYLQTIKSKKKIQDNRILYQTLTQAQLTSPQQCPLEADGELIGFLPATVSVASKKILFLR
ncbi:MAG: YegS/Rv2252/BmrU family lipid kinase [Cyclobacteriaceae bacterium]|nr:YegS/Rv2252/BmrU family lipid kinase [Cyclobacteriaceae bacterium]